MSPKLFLSAGLALAVAAPALAQSPIPAAPLDEVVVTAQKREQRLQDVPFSVAVLDGEAVSTLGTGGEDILALSARVPSLYAESSSGRIFPRFYIRGLGNTDFDLNANQPVSVVHDEVVLENPVLKGFPLFDVERVEVLRGPQGTLFGRNTPAGVVKFDSVRPSQETDGYLRAAYGRFDSFDIEGALGGAISDVLSARVSGLYQSRDDFVDNTFFPAGGEEGFNEFEEFAGRVQFLYEPRDGFSALLNIHGRDLDGGSRLFRANVIAPGTNDRVEAFDRFETAQDATQILETSSYGGSLRIDADVGPGVLTSVTAVESVDVDARGDVDGGFGAVFAPPSGPGLIPFSAESADNIEGHYQFTQELRYNFDARDDLNLTVGGFVFVENLDIENLSFDTLAGGELNGFAVQEQDTTAFAVFGSATWDITERLSATGGLRLSVDSKDFVASRLVGPFGSGQLAPVSQRLDDTVVSGDFSLDYEVSPALSVYGRYARGFRAPNVQGRIVFGDAVTVADTETIDSFEVGARTRFLDGRGTFNLSGFFFETDDQQLTAVGGAGNFNQLLNASSVRGFGVEAEATLNPLDGLDLSAGFSFNDTEIRDDDLRVATCGAPCTVLDPVDADGLALIDGNRLPQAPRFIANGSARYGLPIGDGAEVYVLGDLAFRSRINFFLYESAEFQSDALTEVGLRGGYIHDGGRFEVAGFARNLFGATEFEGAIDFNNFSAFVNEPSIYGVEVVTRF